MTQRRDTGTGSLYHRERDNMWCAVVELPRQDGERRRKVIVRARKADAIVALREVRKDLERTGDLTTSSPTLAVWMTRWLDKIAAPRLKPRTLTTYRCYSASYIVPILGRIRLDKLTADHVRRMHVYITTEQTGAHSRRALSTTTALQAHRILAKALTDAMREGRISRNPTTLLDAPRKAVTKRQSLDADEARHLLLSVAALPDEAAAWAVALLAGMRQGERLGLTTDAVDLTTDLITVSWQLQRLTWRHGCGAVGQEKGPWPCGRVRGGSCPSRHIDVPSDQEARQVRGGLWMTRPKSRAGWREVPICPLLHDVLARYIEAHPAGVEGLVFTRPDGHPVDPRDDMGAWDAALRRAGLPDVVLHSARHTTATLLYALGVPEQTREQILGHSSATTTAAYTHIADALTRDAMARLGTLLGPVQIEG